MFITQKSTIDSSIYHFHLQKHIIDCVTNTFWLNWHWIWYRYVCKLQYLSVRLLFLINLVCGCFSNLMNGSMKDFFFQIFI